MIIILITVILTTIFASKNDNTDTNIPQNGNEFDKDVLSNLPDNGFANAEQAYTPILQLYFEIIESNNFIRLQEMNMWSGDEYIPAFQKYNFCYALADINNDKVKELVLATVEGKYIQILAIYTLSNGIPIQIWVIYTGNPNREYASIDKSGSIVESWHGGGVSYEKFNRISTDGSKLVFEKSIHSLRYDQEDEPYFYWHYTLTVGSKETDISDNYCN